MEFLIILTRNTNSLVNNLSHLTVGTNKIPFHVLTQNDENWNLTLDLPALQNNILISLNEKIT